MILLQYVSHSSSANAPKAPVWVYCGFGGWTPPVCLPQALIPVEVRLPFLNSSTDISTGEHLRFVYLHALIPVQVRMIPSGGSTGISAGERHRLVYLHALVPVQVRLLSSGDSTELSPGEDLHFVYLWA